MDMSQTHPLISTGVFIFLVFAESFLFDVAFVDCGSGAGKLIGISLFSRRMWVLLWLAMVDLLSPLHSWRREAELVYLEQAVEKR